MAGKCSICKHPKRQYINRMLMNPKNSERAIASRYGVSRAALQRHRAHLGQGISDIVTNDRSLAAYDPLKEFLALWQNTITGFNEAGDNKLVQLYWHKERRALLEKYFDLQVENLKLMAKSASNSTDDISATVRDILETVTGQKTA